MEEGKNSNYFYAIAYEFLSRTKRSYFLTPLEIDLIIKWQKERIPLSVVLKGLEAGFKKSGRKKTLLYFKGFVEREYKNFSKASVGKRRSYKGEKKDDSYNELMGLIELIKDDDFKSLYEDFFSKERSSQEREDFDRTIDNKIIEIFGSEMDKYREEWEKKFSFIRVDEETKLSLVKKYLIVKKREELRLFSVLI